MFTRMEIRMPCVDHKKHQRWHTLFPGKAAYVVYVSRELYFCITFWINIWFNFIKIDSNNWKLIQLFMCSWYFENYFFYLFWFFQLCRDSNSGFLCRSRACYHVTTSATYYQWSKGQKLVRKKCMPLYAITFKNITSPRYLIQKLIQLWK